MLFTTAYPYLAAKRQLSLMTTVDGFTGFLSRFGVSAL